MSEKEVVILGVAVSKFGRVTGRPNKEFALEVGRNALKDAGIDYRDIQIGFAAHCHQPLGTGTDVFGELGITGIPITNVEVACASQTRSVLLAAELIAAGAYDTAMVIGIEKLPRGMVPIGGDAADYSYEGRMGLVSAPGDFALEANHHMHLYGTKREHFAKAAEKAHRNGSLNPNATYQDVYTLDEIMSSRMIAEPITMLMCSANADGCTATIVCSKEKARQYTSNPMVLCGWSAGSPLYVKGEKSLGTAPFELLGEKAYEVAGVGPKDIEVAQVHDAFSPLEVFFCEDLGFCPRGEGGPFVWEGNTEINGTIPINTDGGLVSCGHPIGATGGRMIYELALQLRGQAGQRQVKGGKVNTALLINEGLGGANVMIFKR